MQRFASAGDYEAARISYCQDMVVREEYVEDAITGNLLRIKDQTLHVSTAADVSDNRDIPAEWKVDHVVDLVQVLLKPSPLRAMGARTPRSRCSCARGPARARRG